MATLNLTGSFLGQSSGPNVDWSPGGSSMSAALSATDFTETAYLRATHTFSEDVVVNSVTYSLSGSLLAGGITSATLHIDGAAVGTISSGFSFSRNVVFLSLVDRELTVTTQVNCSPYSGTPPTLVVNYPTFTVTYEPLPVLHNLGINF